MDMYIYLDQPKPSNLWDLVKNPVSKPKTRLCQLPLHVDFTSAILFNHPEHILTPMLPGIPVQAPFH